MPRITVGLRLRPVNENEKTITCTQQITNRTSVELIAAGTKHEFILDKLYEKMEDQENVFANCTIPILDDVIDGYNGCIFAYGQTGAGKTFTMSGPEGDYDKRGICIRAASYIFRKASMLAGNASSKTSESIAVRLSILEIYNESVIDLLVEPTPSFNSITPAVHAKLTIVETPSGVIVPGLHIMPVNDEEGAIQILNEAQANRAVAEHQLNMKSSRSHVIYTYYIDRTKFTEESSTDAEVMQSKVHFVDLAGSERMNKTGSTGTVMKEANYINKSLSYLEQVVIALTQSKREHIPYRQSKLTYLLKDSLGGNCNTFMMACVWPHPSHTWETLSTLRFAARMKCIETHPVRNSLGSKEPVSAKLLQQLDLLKKELVLRDVINGKDAWLPELTRHQKFRAYRQSYQLVTTSPPLGQGGEDIAVSVANMVTDGTISVSSLSHLYLIIATLKAAIWDLCQNDPKEVSRSMKSSILSHNATYADKLADILDPPDLNRPDLNSSAAADLSAEKAASPSSKAAAEEAAAPPSSYPDGSAADASKPIQSSGALDDGDAQELFELFKVREGKLLNDSYEETKETLRLSKLRQKEIISLLNSQKAIIDSLTTQLTDSECMPSTQPSSSATSTEISGAPGVDRDATRAALESQLDEAKRSYKTAHTEMKLCKDQIAETQSLKKRAMVSLLQEFAEFQATFKIS